MLRLTRSQALGAKWSRLNGKKLAGEEDGLYLKRGKVDVCPDHGELPPFVPAPKVPKERKPRKPRKPRPKMRDLAVSA